ncbi:hypothetical protein [uncultured Roseovarius sp.]|uniref:hypothetical protein n=1 Tax=uncultured Roseovarius sp. TaxID=293344 RepID=UPI002628DC22|nr:hypothetical protein [uncultured Roseovarius sp.]
MFEDLSPVIIFRMSERLLLTGIVIVVALVVLVGFWKTVQRVTLKDGGPLGVAGSVALSTPVFALLAIILYAWVSLSHPISFNAAKSAPEPGGAQVAALGGDTTEQFTGAVNTQTHAVAPEDVSNYARQRTRHQIWTLNCLADSTVVRAPAQTDLTDIKLRLMQDVWHSDWDNPLKFENWARNPSEGSKPPPEALEFFDGRHTGC